MRTATRIALIVCALLLLLGLGWYVQHMDEVHDWLRALGRKHHAADEVVLKQRTTAVLPGLDGTVKVRVDDIKRGKTADVEIIGPESMVLASKKGARVGDRIAFTHDSKEYEVEVIRYVDKIGPGDTATFRIISLPSDTKPAEPGASDQVVKPDGNGDKLRELAQDHEAEKLFRDMEKKIKAANAVQIAVDLETRAIKGSEDEKKLNGKVFKAKGFLLFTKDNKVQMTFRGDIYAEMVSNGKELTLARDSDVLLPDELAKPMPTPKYLHDVLGTLVSRVGVMNGSFVTGNCVIQPWRLKLGKNEGFDAEKLGWSVSDFKAGTAAKVGGRDAKVISYPFGVGTRETQTLWLDNKTLLPLKRLQKTGASEITEIYAAFNLDPKIDAKAFELVHNEAEKTFLAMMEKIKAAQAVEVTFDSVGKAKEQGKEWEMKAKGSLLFTKDNKARFKMSGSVNETGKEVTIEAISVEAISDGKHWKTAHSPAKIAEAAATPTPKDLHSLLSTDWSKSSFSQIAQLFNGEFGVFGPQNRRVAFEAGAAENVGGRDAKVVTYSVVSMKESYRATLWIDAETALPLKLVVVFEKGRVTENCNFNLAPKVDTEAFALPK